MDPSGVVLERVCGPVREYLHSRDDTVRCIVASLTSDSDSELAEVNGVWIVLVMLSLVSFSVTRL